MKTRRRKISIVVPIYNEADLIPELITRLTHSVSSLDHDYELIFVDDRSTDATEAIFKSIHDKSVVYLVKKGKRGKAFSLIEGFKRATGDIICMIDGDLQYPPEEILPMVRLLEKADIVVAHRKEYSGSRVRRIMSKSFRYVFGTVLFGLQHDIQSGLKVFTREVLNTVKVNPTSGWTFDLEFLHKAREAGFIIASHEIEFSFRRTGNSKVEFLKTAGEIGLNALILRFKKIRPQHIPPQKWSTMSGSGVGYKRKKYITHTTLPHQQTAMQTLHTGQKIVLGAVLAMIVGGLVANPLTATVSIVAILSSIYFIDVLFNLYLVLKSLHDPQEISSTQKELDAINNAALPIYSILCPLYREAHVIPQFLSAIDKLDWPKEKLDVILLLEEDDVESIDDVAHMDLPAYVRTIIVPHSAPKTKPKACNYGLSHAKGEYLVIYDAEDVPDSLQLKKAYLAFQKVPRHVVCLQAKLNYYNPEHNVLTRFFTAEYSLWFDVTLAGLQSINTTIPLGGTSNHFRTRDLTFLQGWDPFNVTEDADLGIRLFKKGYKTAIFDSTTLEEANSNFFNWMRQRSRWLKGYMQTYLVHMREILSFTKKQGLHAVIFQLVIGGKIAFTLINPLLWLATISYFALYAQVGPTIEKLYPASVFYMAAFSLVFGNFLFLYYYMVGCMKREQYSLIKYIFLIPIYWLMISVACMIALYQLIFKPHYWEKTIHGLHLKKNIKKAVPQVTIEVIEQRESAEFPLPFRSRFAQLFVEKKTYLVGGFLITASILANVLNFAFNAYLGRVMDLGNFALLSLVSSFLYITQIPFSAIGSAVNYRAAFLEGRHGDQTPEKFRDWIRRKSLVYSTILYVLWVLASPLLVRYFSSESILPYLIFAPVWIVGMLTAIDRGYLSGKLMFGSLAIVALVEPISKLVTTVVLVEIGQLPFVYTAIPISILVSFVAGRLLSKNKNEKKTFIETEAYRFPFKFFMSSFLSGLSTITFLSLDIILANHYLSPEDAGLYSLLSLIGKMIFFLASLSQQFMTPLVSRNEGKMKNSDQVFYLIFIASCVLAGSGYVLFGLLGGLTIPFLFGERALAITSYLPYFCLAMLLFSMSRVFVSYHQSKNIYSFSLVTFLLAIVQIGLISVYHGSIQGIVLAMLMTGGLNLLAMAILHVNTKWVIVFEHNIADLWSLLFEKQKIRARSDKNLRILFLNWRDTKHVWAGGAEVYIHEIAKRWVEEGHTVTVFCGNDGHRRRNQTLDGVYIVRRGGSYTVYFWAFLYYIFRFRGNYDVIVDSENGIPFFSPLYSRIPVFLLIHHVHQDVFRKHLPYPFSAIAEFLEAKVMPFIYKHNTVITVSESSKHEIIKLGLSQSGNVEIVNPGVILSKHKRQIKTTYPSFLYLGRLKPYKNIDIAIGAFARISKKYPLARLSIVGEGEMIDPLITLAHQLKIQEKVMFYGKVTDAEKAFLLSESWAFLQPSQLEGWGITVIEANAHGTPVIASNVPGLRDSVLDGQTGMLVPLRDTDTFAQAMDRIVSDATLRKSLSKDAFSWSSNFTWDRSAGKFLSIIISDIEKKLQYRATGKLAFARQTA